MKKLWKPHAAAPAQPELQPELRATRQRITQLNVPPCRCNDQHLLSGMRSTGGFARQSRDPSSFPPRLWPSLSQCSFRKLISNIRVGTDKRISDRTTPQYLLAHEFALLGGRSVLMIGDCFERRLLEQVCTLFSGGDIVHFAGKENKATFACAIPIGCSGNTVSSCTGNITLGMISVVGVAGPPWYKDAYVLPLRYMSSTHLAQPAHVSVARMIHEFKHSFGKPALVTMQSLAWDYAKWAMNASLQPCEPCRSWSTASTATSGPKLPSGHPLTALPIRDRPQWFRPSSQPVDSVHAVEALHWWAKAGEAHVEQWTHDAARLARAVVHATGVAMPVYWRTRHVPLVEAVLKPNDVQHYHMGLHVPNLGQPAPNLGLHVPNLGPNGPNRRELPKYGMRAAKHKPDPSPGADQGTSVRNPATPLLPRAYAAMNEAIRANHASWGIKLLDWGRFTTPFEGWYHPDGLHQHGWVSTVYFELLLNTALAATDEHALATRACDGEN